MDTQICGLSAKVEGSGKAVLLLHGYLSSKESFYYQIKHLSKKMMVIAVDMTGFGNSPEMLFPYSVTNYADEIEGVINSLGLEKVDVIAHSFGGRVACKIANRGRVDRLVLTGSAGVKPRRNLQYYFKVYGYKTIKRFLTEEQRKKFGSEDYKQLSSVMKESFIKIVNENLDEEFKKIKVPTLIINGDKDRETPPYSAKKLNRYIEGSRLEMIEGAGHFCFIDKEKLFNEYIGQFLY